LAWLLHYRKKFNRAAEESQENALAFAVRMRLI